MTQNEHNLFRNSFIDRNDILERISDAFSSYVEGKLQKKVFLLVGISGIGKTKLINEIAKTYNDVFSKDQLLQITLHLEILGEETAITILQKIREKIILAPLFDYAFLKYWELSKVSQLDTKYLKILAESLPIEISSNLLTFIDAAVPFLGTGLSIGTSAISKIIKKGDGYYSKAYKQNNLSVTKNLIDTYVKDDPIKILAYLPELLAIDMENQAANKRQLYIFDAYDKATKYTIDGIEWLKSLVKSFRSGIFIITSREMPSWSNTDFDCPVETLLINEIPEAYVREALCEYGICKKAADKIISLTQCVPIYLDLALFIYEKEGTEGLDELRHNKREEFAIKFIDHLSEDRQWIVKMLSIIQFVDSSVYDEILAANQLSKLKNPFDDFVSSTLISYVEKHESFYKIHDVLATDICTMLPIESKQMVAIQFIEIIKKNLYRHKANDNYFLICKCFQLGNSLFDISSDRQKFPHLGDSLVQLSLYLIENGFCYDLYTWAKSLSVSISSPVHAAFYFTSASFHRNTDILEGIAILNSVDFKSSWIDKQRKLFICETNYLESIAGYYLDAEEKFMNFYKSLRKNERDSVFYTKGSLYHADMLMMRGQFIDAIDIMEEILELQTEQNSFTYFEIQKAIGHCHRFNWMLDKALASYCCFEGNYAESIRMEAYRLTTECETYCFFDHLKVLAISKEAIEKNLMIHNNNNLGKIYISLCIAYIQEEKYDCAQVALDMARNLFKTTQYKSGTFFASIAEVFLQYAVCKTIDLALLKSINRQLEEIGNIYIFLLLPVYLLTKNDRMLDQLKIEVQWINFDETVRTITGFIRRL